MQAAGSGHLSGDLAATLALVVAGDSTILQDPPRLRRALADLAPDDDLGPDLLVRALELGVPRLVDEERASDAFTALYEVGGLRTDLIREIVQIWTLVMTPDRKLPVRDDPPGLVLDVDDHQNQLPEEAEETPNGISLVRLGRLPQGPLLLIAGTANGLFAAGAARRCITGWRRLATPNSALSRDAWVLSSPNENPVVMWTDRGGVTARSVKFTPGGGGARGSSLSANSAQFLLVTHDGEQPRYPMAAIVTRADILDVFWTSDRRVVRRSTVREGGGWADTVLLPDACGATERLSAIDVRMLAPERCIVVVLTDRSRILASEWDLRLDIHMSWASMASPVATVSTMALLSSGDGLDVVTCTSDGRVFSSAIGAPTAEPRPWLQLGRPLGMPEGATAQSMAAIADANGSAMALAGSSGVWLCNVDRRRDGRLVLGEATLAAS
jgi:hypothetical protein